MTPRVKSRKGSKLANFFTEVVNVDAFFQKNNIFDIGIK